MGRIALIGLLKIELPTQTVRLCDGGFLVVGADTFRSSDPVFGAIASVQLPEETAGAMVPALQLTLNPAAGSAPADLSQPGFQRSRARFWLAEYNPVTGLVIGTPEPLFDGWVDQTVLTVGRDSRELAITVVSQAERLFERNIGNSLNPSWHQSIWPGEAGHDNATGLGYPVAWGVESPPSAYTGAGGGFAGGGGSGWLSGSQVRVA